MTLAPRVLGAWRLLDDAPASGAFNMAVDEWLMESVRDGGAPTLRLYGWSPPCLSLGRNQPARTHYLGDFLRDAGVEVVRRPTGGRAVLHDREITYAVVAPSGLLGSARDAYRTINEVLLDAVLALGAPAVLARPNGRASPIPSTVPCFAESLPGEIMIAGRKLVGSAQMHREGVLLQHGSILLGRSPAAKTVERATSSAIEDSAAFLEDAVRITPTRAREAVVQAWSGRFGPLESWTPTGSQERRVADISRRFEDDRWTWRR